MKSRDVESLVAELLERIVKGKGIEIVDVEFALEGGQRYLRVYIDRPEGVSMNDCAWLNEELGRDLDRLDPIPQSYVLEVSSSGEKPLRREEDYVRFRGRRVLVKTRVPIEGRKTFDGKLLGLADGIVAIDIEGRVAEVPRDKISHARLVAEI